MSIRTFRRYEGIPTVLLVKLEEDTMNSPQELRDNDPSTIPR